MPIIFFNCQEVIQNSRKEITVSMMKNYPQLMRKYMADKTKVPSLLEIISHMDLELYSLKSQEQVFRLRVSTIIFPPFRNYSPQQNESKFKMCAINAVFG